MSTWAQPGRLRRPGRGLKTEEKSANSQLSKPPHTQKSGHPRDTPNFGPFQNIQTALRADYYWTGVPYNSQSFEPASWYFRPTSGYQDWEIRRFGGFAVAVRPGPVPEPPTAALALLALGLAAVLRRKAS
jgi:MYXO-CTERM domain-containing protein